MCANAHIPIPPKNTNYKSTNFSYQFHIEITVNRATIDIHNAKK